MPLFVTLWLVRHEKISMSLGKDRREKRKDQEKEVRSIFSPFFFIPTLIFQSLLRTPENKEGKRGIRGLGGK